MTKNEQMLLALLTLSYGKMTNHMINLDKEFSKDNANVEQMEAHWKDMIYRRNDVAKILVQFSDSISNGLKDLKELQGG